MSSSALTLLNDVLKTQDSRLGPLKDLLSTRQPTILEVTHGDGSALLETYSIRAEIAAEKGRASESYADLVISIKNRRPKSITVLHVGIEEAAFLVFTDSDDKQILGVIPGHTAPRPARTPPR